MLHLLAKLSMIISCGLIAMIAVTACNQNQADSSSNEKFTVGLNE
jgi:hypothetical protein